MDFKLSGAIVEWESLAINRATFWSNRTPHVDRSLVSNCMGRGVCARPKTRLYNFEGAIMNMRWMSSAVVAIGALAAPVMAGERGIESAGVDVRVGAVPVDRDWREHREWREHRDVAIAQVPPPVVWTAERVGHGRHIDSIALVRTARGDFFLVHMSRYDKQPIRLRIDPGGGLIGIDREW